MTKPKTFDGECVMCNHKLKSILTIYYNRIGTMILCEDCIQNYDMGDEGYEMIDYNDTNDGWYVFEYKKATPKTIYYNCCKCSRYCFCSEYQHNLEKYKIFCSKCDKEITIPKNWDVDAISSEYFTYIVY